MTFTGFLLMLIIAAVAGAVGQALAGYSLGGCVASIVVGFVGAFIGTMIATEFHLPDFLTIDIDGVWLSIILGGRRFGFAGSIGRLAFPPKEIDMTTHPVDVRPEDRQERITMQQQGGIEHQERIIEDRAAEQQLFSYRLTQFIYWIFGVLEVVIGLRVLFKLIDANPANVFAHYLYQLTDLFLKPFANLTPNLSNQGMVLEYTSLIAMLIYGITCAVIVMLVRLLLYRTRTRTVSISNKELR